MKRTAPRRNWTLAREKLDAEGCCRRCGSTANLEAAHITERVHDRTNGLRDHDGDWWFNPDSSIWLVHPDRIYPLCGPFPGGCHGAEHRHEFDSLPLLTLPEQLQAVADCGGIEQARVRLAPSQYGASRLSGERGRNVA